MGEREGEGETERDRRERDRGGWGWERGSTQTQSQRQKEVFLKAIEETLPLGLSSSTLSCAHLQTLAERAGAGKAGVDARKVGGGQQGLQARDKGGDGNVKAGGDIASVVIV